MKTPLYIAYHPPPPPPLFFKFWSTSPPNTLTIILTACYVLHNDVMDRHKLNLSTFVPQGPCGVFYGIRFRLPEVYFAGSWFDITQTKTHNTNGPIDWHKPYKYILTSPVTCSQQLPVLHWMHNLLLSKIFFNEFHNPCFFKITDFEKLHICCLDSVRFGSSHKTQRILIGLM